MLFSNTNNFAKSLHIKINLSWLLGSLQKMCPWHFPQVWNKCITLVTVASTGPTTDQTPQQYSVSL